ncbi:transmembrane and immunoglobulin domain-containing protein 2 [Gopherus flavomarginatus]|uniref:transmembrane and immunoglobulin domain-containing protein 2 n=1 Tax=Gopherus flavomarginatus TaxID=286002 RepID=UPI0021CC29FD|nr:transmembrane and immunoglobulin domain-containing protein 2 [Gopherus flavomarginatus]
MQRLEECLLLLLLAAFLLEASEEAGTLKVRQDPAQILAPVGGSVELSCQINTAQRWEQLRVEWQRDSPLMVFCQVVLNKTSVSNCCRGVGVCDDARLSFTWHPPKFTLRMSNINEDDVGWYVCKAIVEIPVNLDATGNGTMLNTSAAAEGGGWLRNHSRDLVLWLGLAGALAITALLLLPAVICCYKRRRRDPGQAIYVNVLFRKKEEGKKDSPRASSEMKQTSLYIQEFQRRGHSWKPPVTERSPGPTKASKKAASFKQRATERP